MLKDVFMNFPEIWNLSTKYRYDIMIFEYEWSINEISGFLESFIMYSENSLNVLCFL